MKRARNTQLSRKKKNEKVKKKHEEKRGPTSACPPYETTTPHTKLQEKKEN
jgi:hypothetical protein